MALPLQLFVKTLTGRKQAFDFEPRNTVRCRRRRRSFAHTSPRAAALSSSTPTSLARCVGLQILNIKEALQEKEGIDVKQIRLIHSGKQLNDTDTIESAKIEAGATVHMVLSLRGGASA